MRAGDFATALSVALRRAGVPVPVERTAAFTRALRLVPPTGREALHATARATLVAQQPHLPVFDAVFRALFDGMLDPADSRGDPNAPPPIGAQPRRRPPRTDATPTEGEAEGGQAAPGSGNDPPEDEATERPAITAASRAERLAQTPFAELDPQDVAEVRALVARLVLATPQRRTRRFRPAARGRRLDLRRTLREAQRTGGDPVRLLHRRQRCRPRRLILLCDVSASMQASSRVYLTLLQAAVCAGQAEAFVFSTRLTRLTRQLAIRDPDVALDRALAAAPDLGGGTRLAESLRAFLDLHGRRGLARGAVVVILSDGWAQDEPAAVAAQMARLARLTHRIVWVNPRKAARGYAPLVGGMAAALPFCDAFVSGHSLAALEEVVTAVAHG